MILQRELDLFKQMYDPNTFMAINILNNGKQFPAVYAYKRLRDRIIEKTVERAGEVLNEDGLLNIENEIIAVKKNGKMVQMRTF